MPQAKLSKMDAYKSLATLQYFLKLFSLDHLSYIKPGFINNLAPFIKVTIIILLFGCFTAYNLYLHFSNGMMKSLSPSVVVVDAIDCILCYLEYIVDLCFIFKYRSKMYAYYYNYDQMDAVYKMKYNEDIKFSVITLLVILLPSWFIASLGQFSIWVSVGGWISPTTYAVSYFTFLIRLLTALDFISQTMHIRLRLKTITDHIKECASFAEDSVGRIKTVTNVPGELIKVLPSNSKWRGEIAKSKSCYLLLIDQAKFLNGFYGVRMLMHCLYTLTDMITFVNFIARVVGGSMSSVMTSYVLLVPSILRATNCVGVLAAMVYQCEACCREAADIIDAVDYFLVNKKTSEELLSSLKTLRKLVTSRPLKFTAAGFFSIEYTLLLSFASVVITYALIIVQYTQ